MKTVNEKAVLWSARMCRVGLFTLALWAGGRAAPAGQSWGIFVGLNHYDPQYGPSALTFCVPDAQAMEEAAWRDARRWPQNHTLLLTDATATKETIVANLRGMATLAAPGDTCVYYHSSHGAQQQEGSLDALLCCYDASLLDSELGSVLAEFDSRTNVIVIIDACFSGGMFRGAGVGNGAATFAQNALAACQQTRAARATARGEAVTRDPGNIAFMTASQWDQFSAEAAEIGHGYFTYEMLNALGQPAADLNSDGVLGFGELFGWASVRASQWNPDQTPQSLNDRLLDATIFAATVPGGVVPAMDPNGGGGQGIADDELEENDTVADAKRLTPGAHQLQGLDEDWFVLALSDEGDLAIDVDGPEGDLDLAVFAEDGAMVAQSDAMGSRENAAGRVPAGTYFLVVYPYEEGATSSYTLTVRLTAAVTPPPAVDSDGDGVLDADDACPNTQPATPVDAQGCPAVPAMDQDDDSNEQDDSLIEPTDSDSDGVPDDADACPETPVGVAVDTRGCPKNESASQSDGASSASADEEVDSTAVVPLIPATPCGFGAGAPLALMLAGLVGVRGARGGRRAS